MRRMNGDGIERFSDEGVTVDVDDDDEDGPLVEADEIRQRRRRAQRLLHTIELSTRNLHHVEEPPPPSCLARNWRRIAVTLLITSLVTIPVVMRRHVFHSAVASTVELSCQEVLNVSFTESRDRMSNATTSFCNEVSRIVSGSYG